MRECQGVERKAGGRARGGNVRTVLVGRGVVGGDGGWGYGWVGGGTGGAGRGKCGGICRLGGRGGGW